MKQRAQSGILFSQRKVAVVSVIGLFRLLSFPIAQSLKRSSDAFFFQLVSLICRSNDPKGWSCLPSACHNTIKDLSSFEFLLAVSIFVQSYQLCCLCRSNSNSNSNNNSPMSTVPHLHVNECNMQMWACMSRLATVVTVKLIFVSIEVHFNQQSLALATCPSSDIICESGSNHCYDLVTLHNRNLQ